MNKTTRVSILILLDYLFLCGIHNMDNGQLCDERLNPYFIGLPILILQLYKVLLQV